MADGDRRGEEASRSRAQAAEDRPPTPPPKPEPEVIIPNEDEPEPLDRETIEKFMEIEERIDAAHARTLALDIEAVRRGAIGLARSLRNFLDEVSSSSADEAVRVAREQAHILDDLDEAIEEFCTWQSDPVPPGWDEDE